MIDLIYLILSFFMIAVYMELKVPLIPIVQHEISKFVNEDGKEMIRRKSITRNQWEYW